jgi:ribosome recycling factor
MVRQVRHDGMHAIKKAATEKEIDEDQQKLAEKKVQELTDEMIAEVDSMGERKEQELLQV